MPGNAHQQGGFAVEMRLAAGRTFGQKDLQVVVAARDSVWQEIFRLQSVC